MAVHEFVVHRIAPSDPLNGFRWSARVLQSVMVSNKQFHFEGPRATTPRQIPPLIGIVGAVSAVVGIGGAILAMIVDVPGLHGIAGLGLVGLTLAGVAYRNHEGRAGH